MDKLEAVRLRYPSKIVSLYVKMVVAPIMRFFPFLRRLLNLLFKNKRRGPQPKKKERKKRWKRMNRFVMACAWFTEKKRPTKKETWQFSVHGEILRPPSHVSCPFCFPLKSNFCTFFFVVCVPNESGCTLMACFLLPPKLPYIVVASLLGDFNSKV